jgi:beta-hydroxylase
VVEAVRAGGPCPSIEYYCYAVANDVELAGISLGCWFCPQCVSDHQLPPTGTVVANPDELLSRTGALYRPMCRGCFEDWQRRQPQDIPAVAFPDPERFPFVQPLEAQWEAIRNEYGALPSDTFDPWVQRQMHGGGWTVFGLYALGQPIPSACARCPRTAKALERVPGLSMAGFSRLAPRTHVKPHVGWAASVYRLHLGLVVPPGCRLRVAGESRAWQEGRCLIFDDTIEHEAWNDSDLPRGVLLLDFLRPGISGRVADHVPEEVREYAAHLFGIGK